MATTQYYGLYIITVDDTMDKLQTGNEAKIDTALHGLRTDVDNKKPKQTAKTDPTASGTSLTFLATFSQNANGEVTVAKKTVATMTGATSGAAGTIGLVPQPAAGAQAKFLRGDGTWQTTPYPSNATTSAAGLMTAADKTKLNGIETGAQVNPGVATTSANGLMSKTDKSKLDGIASGAQVNPGNATQSAAGLMSKDDKKKLDGIAAGAQVNPGVATTSANGLMSKDDKSKLNGIQAGAQVNPGNATTSSAGLMSTSDKSKLNGIEAGAQVNPGAATSSTLGLMKIGYSENGKNYAVKLDSNNKAYVNVPWAKTAFQTKNYSYQYTANARSYVLITGTNLGVSTPSGYSPVGLVAYNPGSADAMLYNYDITKTGSGYVMTLFNLANATLTATLGITILYMQNP